jgi:multisite-specific tRNA:(cytosine-C5)-methyltransferase
MIPNISLGKEGQLKFDRILADVPCSGDGTMRKNLEIWTKWLPSDGNSLHIVQLRILDRAMNLLKPGGRLVYSTCSFNPAENESVVAAALNAHPGEFTIVDVADQLPGLKRRPGVSSWKVATRPDEELMWHDSYESYRARVDEGLEREKDKDKGLPRTVWAPANAAELGLERSLRLLPHDQNTGGFYVCVLEKKATAAQLSAEDKARADALKVKIEDLPQPAVVEAIDEKGATSLKRAASPSAEEPAEKSAKTERGKKKEKRDLQFREDPFSFVDPEHDEVKLITDWFKLQDSFPKGNLLVRNDYGNPLRTIYIVNDVVKAVIQNNDYTRLRMISAGVKSFIRQDSQQRTDIKCKWRVSSDAIDEVLQHIPADSVYNASIAELRTFLVDMYPPIDKFQQSFKAVLDSLDLGCIICRFEAGEAAGGRLTLPLVMPVWKARQSMSLLIDKTEKAVLSERVFGENICRPAPPPKAPGEAASAVASADVTATNTAATTAEPTPEIEVEPEVEVKPEDEEEAANAA